MKYFDFSKSSRTNPALTVTFSGMNPYCILSTSSPNCLSKTFSYNWKACSNNFILLYEFGQRESPVPLKIDINELNIHSSNNLPSNKKSLNVAVKGFVQGSLPAFNISKTTPDDPVASPFVYYSYLLYLVHIQSPRCNFHLFHIPRAA